MRSIFSFLFLVCLVHHSFAQTYILDSKILEKNKKEIKEGNQEKITALNALKKTSEKILKAGKVYSVMHKKQVPPSGDKHDYLSTGPYWWPDPSKADGLPYIRRDGEVNPTYHDITDTDELDDMVSDVRNLALTFYFTNNEKYAEYAVKLIKIWFLNADTKQNPNLNFGQGIPGLNTGRGIGIIESRGFTSLIDAAILLKKSKHWSEKEEKDLKSWFAEYTDWLVNSKNGIEESKSKNNHGTHYDAQLICFALYANKRDIALKQIEVSKARLKVQIMADGSQPLELERTASWNYTNMNLGGFFDIAHLGEHLGVDLWNYKNENIGIKTAVDWFLPYVKDGKAWDFKQIKKYEYEEITKNLVVAYLKFKDANYLELAKNYKKEEFNRPILKLTLL